MSTDKDKADQWGILCALILIVILIYMAIRMQQFYNTALDACCDYDAPIMNLSNNIY